MRRTIHNFYLEQKCVPTGGKLSTKLATSTNYSDGHRSLRHLLKNRVQMGKQFQVIRMYCVI
jgi:hypothetical protein